MKIKVCMGFDDYSNMNYYNVFSISDSIPREGSVYCNEKVINTEQMQIDKKRNSKDVFDYRYYKVKTNDWTYYLATKKNKKSIKEK